MKSVEIFLLTGSMGLCGQVAFAHEREEQRTALEPDVSFVMVAASRKFQLINTDTNSTDSSSSWNL